MAKLIPLEAGERLGRIPNEPIIHEMYSFWVKVISRDGDTVTALEGTGRLAQIWQGSIQEFQQRFAYGSIHGYSIQLYAT